MNKVKIRISLYINVIVAILTVIASIIMFSGFKFMHGVEPVLETTKVSMFRFFTVDSNLLMGVAAVLFAIQEKKILNDKRRTIPINIYILKLMGTTSVGLTFFTVFVFLGPMSPGGIPSMIRNSNLFFHLLIPVMSILNFILLERTNKLKFRHTLYGLVPTILYEMYYLTNVLIHTENGMVSTEYDWYWFVQIGVWASVIIAPLMLIITYLISLVLWRLNKVSKGEKNE